MTEKLEHLDGVPDGFFDEEVPYLTETEFAKRFPTRPFQKRFKKGTYKCDACQKKSAVPVDDIVRAIPAPGGVAFFYHLAGARCKACGYEALEAEDQDRIDRVLVRAS